MYKKLLYIFTGVLAIFISEHFGREYDLTYRPSYFLWKIAVFSEMVWEELGKLFAILSSFYDLIIEFLRRYIHKIIDFLSKYLRKFTDTFSALMKPISHIVFSVSYFVKGYIDQVQTYQYPILVTFGSMTLMVILCFLSFYIYGKEIINFIEDNPIMSVKWVDATSEKK